MAADGVDDFFVILPCSREFSSGTSLNKQSFQLIINDRRVIVEISLHTFFRYLCVEMSRVSVVGVV